jgi:hypothetical protein
MVKRHVLALTEPVALLGREEFMSEFEVWFDHRRSRFSLRPY